MSKGNPMFGVRVSHETADQMEAEVEKFNLWTSDEPQVTAQFIAAAIREKIGKKKRGRAKYARRKARLAEMLRLPLALDVWYMLS